MLTFVAVNAAGRTPSLFPQHMCAHRIVDRIGGKRGVEGAMRRCIAVLACDLLSVLWLLYSQAVLTVSALIAYTCSYMRGCWACAEDAEAAAEGQEP